MLQARELPHGLVSVVRDSFLDCFEGQQVYTSGKSRREDRNQAMMQRFTSGETMQRLCLEYRR